MKKVIIAVVLVVLLAVGFAVFQSMGDVVAKRKLANFMDRLEFVDEYSYKSFTYNPATGEAEIDDLRLSIDNRSAEALLDTVSFVGVDEDRKFVEKLSIDNFNLTSLAEDFNLTVDSFVLNGFDASMMHEYSGMNARDAYYATLFAPSFALDDMELSELKMIGSSGNELAIRSLVLDGPFKMKELPRSVDLSVQDVFVKVDGGIAVTIPTIEQKRRFNQESMEYSEELSLDVTDISSIELGFALADFNPEALQKAYVAGESIQEMLAIQDLHLRMQDKGAVDRLFAYIGTKDDFISDLRDNNEFVDSAAVDAIVEFVQAPGLLELTKGDSKVVRLFDVMSFSEAGFNQLNLMLSVNGKPPVSLQMLDPYADYHDEDSYWLE